MNLPQENAVWNECLKLYSLNDSRSCILRVKRKLTNFRYCRNAQNKLLVDIIMLKRTIGLYDAPFYKTFQNQMKIYRSPLATQGWTLCSAKNVWSWETCRSCRHEFIRSYFGWNGYTKSNMDLCLMCLLPYFQKKTIKNVDFKVLPMI